MKYIFLFTEIVGKNTIDKMYVPDFGVCVGVCFPYYATIEVPLYLTNSLHDIS